MRVTFVWLCLWCHYVLCEERVSCEKGVCKDDVEELRINAELNEYEQDDERLIEILKNDYLVKPDPSKKLWLSQNPTSSSLGGQFGQPYEIDDMYK